jgi:hypothetical protein
LSTKPIPWGLEVISPGVKLLGRESHHEFPSGDEVKNCRFIPPPYIFFMSLWLIK